MTTTAMTVAPKADHNSTILTHNHIYFTHGLQKMNKTNTTNTRINNTKKTTDTGEEVYEDDAEGETIKKILVTNITLYIRVPLKTLNATLSYNCTVCKKPNIHI